VKRVLWLVASIAAAALGAGGVEEAAATTICVPSVAAACPGTGGAVGKTDLEEAMSYQGADGTADQIMVAAGTYSENGAGFEPGAGSSTTTFEPTGSDPLTITGAGEGTTTMTSTSSANAFVVNLSYNNTRTITIRDLTIEAPASMPDGLGAAILLYKGDTLERVAVVSLNKESDAVIASGAGNVLRDVEARGGGSGDLDYGFAISGPGAVVAEDSVIREASWALTSQEGSLAAHRVSILGSRTYGALVSSGLIAIDNSVITLDDGIGFYVGATEEDGTLTADHVTVVNSGGSTYPALEGKKFSGLAGDATMNVSNSIFRDFGSGYQTETPFGPGIGLVSLKVRYSDLPSAGSSKGGSADLSTGNIDADPLLAADYSLLPGSPAIDAGDPSFGINADFLGAPRPVDGNGDGVAVQDQGAFEYQPPAPPAGGGDTTAPQTKVLKGPGSGLAAGRAKFRFSSSEAGSRFECKLDRAKPARCRSPKRYRRLKPGKHVFKVWAVDAAGNKDPSPARRRFRVPGSA
jgi:hypothetical protein